MRVWVPGQVARLGSIGNHLLPAGVDLGKFPTPQGAGKQYLRCCPVVALPRDAGWTASTKYAILGSRKQKRYSATRWGFELGDTPSESGPRLSAKGEYLSRRP